MGEGGGQQSAHSSQSRQAENDPKLTLGKLERRHRMKNLGEYRQLYVKASPLAILGAKTYCPVHSFNQILTDCQS